MTKASRKTAAPAPATTPDAPIAGNKYGVASKVWGHWSADQQRMFNELFRYIYDNQPLFKHPKAPLLETEQWKTVAWNAAWIAADLSKEA